MQDRGQQFIMYDSFWANSSDCFSGPYSSRKAAEATLKEAEFEYVVWGEGESPKDIRTCYRVQIVTPSEVATEYRQSFRRFYQQWQGADNDWLDSLPLEFDPQLITHKVLRRIMAQY